MPSDHGSEALTATDNEQGALDSFCVICYEPLPKDAMLESNDAPMHPDCAAARRCGVSLHVSSGTQGRFLVDETGF
jgi:hypothetical protein